MMRFILYEGDKSGVPLTREFDFIRHYVALMQLRYTNKVEILVDLPSEAPDKTVPPLMLISFIENAFKHGISPTEPSFVHIQVFIDKPKQEVTFDIRNSNFPKTEEDRSGHGIGLQQVERRLQLIYPGKHIWEKGVTDDGKTYYSRITIDTK